MHIMAIHIPNFIKEDKNIKQFSCQATNNGQRLTTSVPCRPKTTMAGALPLAMPSLREMQVAPTIAWPSARSGRKL